MFQKIIQDKYLSRIDSALLDERFTAFSAVFASPEKQNHIRNSKEEQYQEGFLRDLFCSVLGYTINPEPDFNLITEKRNESAAETRSRDTRKADGAIILNGNVRVVIELKGCDTIDLARIEPQAFGYKAHNPDCRYVVISNFEKLRFYIDDAADFLEFNLFSLSREDFALLYLCLALPQIAADVPAKLKQESLSREISVTDKLYADYSTFKRALFADIVARNGEKFDKLLLFRKTQKLLDRLLFVLFCEDHGLLPANSLVIEIEKWRQLKALDAYVPLYERIKKYFRYIDSGYANDDKTYVIYAYNGGLFKADDVLDAIEISDDVLFAHASRLAEYDFESEVSVDILGHIFEHSLSEIEEIQNEIAGNPVPAVGKRKKDGVFYTPAYITKYIVENTIGKLCDEKKTALGISDEVFAGAARNKNQKAALSEKLKAYRDWLLSLKICDPACGSGAFLNAALQFLKREHALIDELSAKIYGDALVLQEVDNAILENNLYGVDINEESVEIAKLSLWLHTAQKGRKLSSLNNNIKCGNSLISTAFDWEKEFPTVFSWRGDNLVSPSNPSSSWRGDNPVALSNFTSPKGDKIVAPPQNSKFYNPTEEVSKSANSHLPHWHQDGKIQFVTFRLADSLPKEKLDELKARKEAFFNLHPEPWDADTALKYSDAVGKLADEWLDAGTGSCVLARTDARKALEDVLFFNDGKQYRLHAFVIMPNHVHILFELLGDTNLSKTLQLWKGISAKNINKILGKSDSLWQKESFDRLVRSERHYNRITNYITENPKNLPASSFSLWRNTWRGDNPVAPTKPASYEGDKIVAPPQNGFDVIIGNPPYGATFSEEESKYLRQAYKFQSYQLDSYMLFLEKTYSLAKDGAAIGLIMPNTWLSTVFNEPLRKFIFENYRVDSINHYSYFAFEDATVETDTYIFRKDRASVRENAITIKFLHRDGSVKCKTISQSAIIEKAGKPINIYESSETLIIKKKLENLPKLGDLVQIVQGTKPFQKGKGKPPQNEEILKEQPFIREEKIDETFLPCLRGSLINRYRTSWNQNYFISYGDWLAEPRYSAKFDVPEKLLVRQTGDSIIATFDNKKFIARDNLYVVRDDEKKTNLKFILTLLNSDFITWFYRTFLNPEVGKTLAQVKRTHLLELPVPPVSPEEQERLVELADKMLSLNAKLQTYSSAFFATLRDNLGLKKITGTLEAFYELDFAGFLKELGKQKIKIALKDQSEWREFFAAECTRSRELRAELAATDAAINARISALYGI